MLRLQHLLTNLQKSPLAMMLVAALLLLALIQTEVRLQVAAYWETHLMEKLELVQQMEGRPEWTAQALASRLPK